MTEIQRGFRGDIAQYVDVSGSIEAVMTISGSDVYDFCCFGVDGNNQLSDDRYMMFYNQTKSPNGELSYSPTDGGAKFTLNLSRLPASIQKLVFTASIDGTGTMGGITSHTFTLGDAVKLRLTGQDFSSEKAIISVEIYRKNDTWRIAAVASGFNGGLSDLLKFYGGEEKPEPEELGKWQKIRLKGTGSGLGEISVNLRWNRDVTPNIDLGCLYALTDGTKGMLQSLGNDTGDKDNPPYISLDPYDEASGNGRTLHINGDKVAVISRVLVFTFMYNGAADWKGADGVITVSSPANPDIFIHMKEYDSKQRMCAAAMFENVNDEALSVEKLMDFFYGHADLEKYYRWGIKWGYGTK